MAFVNSPQGFTAQPWDLKTGLGKQAPPVLYMGAHPTLGGAIFSSGGNLSRTDLQGRDPAELANDLIRNYGSDGSISLSQVEDGLGLNDPNAPPDYIKSTKALVESDWKALAGGSQTLTADQLTSTIAQYMTSPPPQPKTIDPAPQVASSAPPSDASATALDGLAKQLAAASAAQLAQAIRDSGINPSNPNQAPSPDTVAAAIESYQRASAG